MDISIPEKINKGFKDAFEQKKRYLIVYGGRGGGRSWNVARVLLSIAAQQKKLILCTREIQKSIRDSVHRVLKNQIDEIGLTPYYEIQRDAIYSKIGSEFIFKGLRHNSSEIKSTEGIDICWVEEGHKTSEDSLNDLIPTIREDGSLIIITFNPDDINDPVYQRFIVNKHPDAIVVNCNHEDNPFFPEVLKKEMEYDKQVDYEKYEHIWLGKPKAYKKALILGDRVDIWDFETPSDVDRFYFGADWGFSEDPSCLIRHFIRDNELWIDYEAYGRHVELDDLPSFFKKVPLADKYPITGDSSRPDTISYLNRNGLRVEKSAKGKGSIEDGIQYLRSFKKINIHSRCKGSIEDYMNYRWKEDRVTGDILPIPIDKANHACDASRYALEKLMKHKKRTIEVF